MFAVIATAKQAVPKGAWVCEAARRQANLKNREAFSTEGPWLVSTYTVTLICQSSVKMPEKICQTLVRTKICLSKRLETRNRQVRPRRPGTGWVRANFYRAFRRTFVSVRDHRFPTADARVQTAGARSRRSRHTRVSTACEIARPPRHRH